MDAPFKCEKCGKILSNKHDHNIHEKDCRGISLTMETLQTIAEKGIEGLVRPQYGFTCGICGETQELDNIDSYKFRPVQGLCDNCISDLKEIILTKRKHNGKAI